MMPETTCTLDMPDGLAAELNRLLIARAVEPKRAARVAAGVAQRLRHDWAGENIYIPVARRFHESINRNEELLAKREVGQTLAQLARDYGLTDRAVRYIVKGALARRLSRR